MNRNQCIDDILSHFYRELKKSKSKAQANLVFEVCKYQIEKVKGDDHEKKSAIRVMTLKKENKKYE